MPTWRSTISGVGEAASQAASGEKDEVPTIMLVVYPPCPSWFWSKTNLV